MGYVEKVHPGGSFIASEGGSDTAADSGLVITYFSAATDRYAEFVHLFPKGEKPNSGFTRTTVRPHLTATLNEHRAPANQAFTVILNWVANLPRPIQVTALRDGRHVPNTDSLYSYPSGGRNTQGARHVRGVTSAVPFSGVPPGRYEIYVTLTGTTLPPVVLHLFSPDVPFRDRCSRAPNGPAPLARKPRPRNYHDDPPARSEHLGFRRSCGQDTPDGAMLDLDHVADPH